MSVKEVVACSGNRDAEIVLDSKAYRVSDLPLCPWPDNKGWLPLNRPVSDGLVADLGNRFWISRKVPAVVVCVEHHVAGVERTHVVVVKV